MNKKILFSTIVVLLLGIIMGVGGYTYFNKNIVHLYGTIPEEHISDNFEKVEYTIPIIDEEGNRGTQTFTLENKVEKGEIIKLYVRNDKVKKYEFINKEDLPETVQNNL